MVLSDFCTWHPRIFESQTDYCLYGCCKTNTYPCCDVPTNKNYVIGFSVGGVVLAGVLMGIVIYLCVRRRRHLVAVVTTTSPGAQTIWSSSTTTMNASSQGYVRM
ncbi:uncharacterized protein LOC106052084 isoform X2 [Biomphalaria glabrata]|uniref:Uncharacterized protein LOC106052084 isoform X2 n=1 Tax=Biomphalaria glabrata TaxID=6526 RepID=A0A9W3AUR0_BIOGL|nr:uncharacterized protein LOC106052084 isoform X2 [Biomphalaria glabrata]